MENIELVQIENDRRITRETDGEFLYEYQKAVLLALAESGRLTETQYRYAEGKLRRQRCDNEKAIPHIRQTARNVREYPRR